MNNYLVKWEVNVEAETAVDAAINVAADYFQTRIQRGQPDTACVFQVEKDGEPSWESDDGELIDLSKIASAITPTQLRKMFVTEHPDYEQHQWRSAIDREETLLGYWEWVMHQLEEDSRV